MFDCQKIHNYLIKNKWEHVKAPSKADLIIINTCSFNAGEDDSSVDLINYYLKRKRPTAKIVIAGCMPKINPSRLNFIREFITISPTDLGKLDDIINAKIKFNSLEEPNRIMAHEISYRPILKKSLSIRNFLSKIFRPFNFEQISFSKIRELIMHALRHIFLIKAYINPFLVAETGNFFYLRISKGCLGGCSYCAKRFATGALKSKPLRDILDEFRKGLDEGYKKFFILSEDTGCYGIDIGTTIVDLLKEMFKIGNQKDFKLIITNFNAQWFVKYAVDLEEVLMFNQDKILYMQIPVQSASNRILKLMNRPYDIEDVKRCYRSLKDRLPSLNITTDIIVGFPGEVQEDFEFTREFVREAGFSYADFFIYEDRHNTLASNLENKVPPEVIRSRRLELLELQNKKLKSTAVLKKISEMARDFA
jgi:tRNA A37 methylthiotransferase MiaB